MGNAARRIANRKKAKETLAGLFNGREEVIVIHYSCQNFQDRPDGSSARITSIAALNLDSRQSDSFSIHQIAEIKGISKSEMESRYNELEKVMLDNFYEYIRMNSKAIWLHWNMRNIHYGFQAIAHRYKVLGGQPLEVSEKNKIGLASILIDLYGDKYIGHPHLTRIVDKNKLSKKDFLAGDDEAEAFEKHEYVKLHFSTLRKVDLLASIAQKADRGILKTDANALDQYGDYLQAIADLIKENSIIVIVLTIIGLIASIFEIFNFIK